MASGDSERSFAISKLTSNNYADWACDARMMLREKGLAKFILEADPAAADGATANEIRQHALRKDRALAMLYLSISQELKSLIKNCTNAFELWEKLRSTYEPKSVARMSQLRRRFLNLSLNEGEDMAIFLCRVDDAVVDCRNAGVDIKNYEHAFQYMDLLPREYEMVTHSLHHLPLDDLTTTKVADTLIAEFHRLSHQKNNGNGTNNGGNGALFTTNNAKQAAKCFNCGKLGHFAKDCRSGQTNTNNNSNSSNSQKPDGAAKKKKKFWRKKKAGGNVASVQQTTAGKGTENASTAVLYAKAFSSVSSTTGTCSPWYVDSGATDHVCSSKEFFSTYAPNSKTLELGEGNSPVLGVGNVLLRFKCNDKLQEVLVTNVLYAPRFNKNLLSIARMDEKGLQTLTKDGVLRVFRDVPSKPLLTAVKEGRLFRLDAQAVRTSTTQIQQKVDNGCTVLANSAENARRTDNDLWHRRFCHQHVRGIQTLKSNNFVHGLEEQDVSGDCPCDVCRTCKLTTPSSSRIVEITSREPLDLLHMDLWGPSRVASYGGCRYLFVIIDDFSRMSFVFPMKTKDQTLEKFQLLVNKLETQQGTKVKAIRTDNGSEFCSRTFADFLGDKGIAHQKTNSYSPQMNGIAERYNRTLIEGTRALLADSGLAKPFWAELATAFNYIRNRSSHSKIGGQTPYGKFNGKIPTVRHFKIIGSRCTVLKAPPKRGDKLDPKGWEGILLGYAQETIGYRVWNPEDKKVYETRNVVIIESASRWQPISEDVAAVPDEPAARPKKQTTPIPTPTSLSWDFDTSQDPFEADVPWTDDPQLQTAGPRVDPGRQLQAGPRVDPGRLQPAEFRVDPSRHAQHTESRVDPGRHQPIESRVNPGRFPLSAVTWHREFSRPRGQDKVQGVRYCNDAGETLYHEQGAKQYHESRGLVFNPRDFDFQTFPGGSEREVDPEISFPRMHRKGSSLGSGAIGDSSNPAALFTAADPANFQEAMERPEKDKWIQAMDEEIETLKQREVFEEMERPPGAKVLGTKWVYKTKDDSSGDSRRHRARLVVQGYRQTQGVDYDEVFSPVVNFVVIRLFMLLLVVRRGWVDVHLDVKCAYLYGELRQITYTALPEGYQSSSIKNSVWLLKRALYGLHQSGREWFQKLISELFKIGFQKIPGFCCAFEWKGVSVLLFYVDDLVLFAENSAILENMISQISKIFDITILGPVRKLLGVTFDRRGEEILIHQRNYIVNLAQEYGLSRNNLIKVPMQIGTVIQKPADLASVVSNFPYRSLVGSLLFLATRTRPDILFSIILLSQYNTCHTILHERCLMQVLQFVLNTQEKAINLSACQGDDLQAFTDASWANDRDDRRSFGGYLVFLGGVPLSWGCKKQSVVALSSMEAEFMAIVNCLREVNWLQGIFRNFKGFENSDFNLPIIFSDSLAAIHFSRNDLETSRTKHIDIKYHFVKDWLSKGYFVLHSVKGTLNLADVFTKPQSWPNMERFLQAVFA